jgi:hypothetical protein
MLKGWKLLILIYYIFGIIKTSYDSFSLAKVSNTLNFH